MEHLVCFTQSLGSYIRELLVPVLLGFFFSGIIHEFVPLGFVNKYLGDDSAKSIFTATWVGAILPVCCMGSLPIAVTLRKKGARLGPVLAFLVATPATSLPALLMTWKLMGPVYTVYIAVVVIVMGLVMGLLGNRCAVPAAPSVHHDCCGGSKVDDCCDPVGHHVPKSMSFRLINAFRYGFWELPREIGVQLLMGAAVASVIVAFAPVRDFVRVQLEGFKGYLLLIVIGLFDYVCSTGSVPVANALVQSGVTAGKSMVYLLMGPITSYGTLLVIRKEFGSKILTLYLLVIAVFSLLAGVFYDVFRL
jgi:uncharacterized membrane protein YraQ (UPF0718 family)